MNRMWREIIWDWQKASTTSGNSDEISFRATYSCPETFKTDLDRAISKAFRSIYACRCSLDHICHCPRGQSTDGHSSELGPPKWNLLFQIPSSFLFYVFVYLSFSSLNPTIPSTSKRFKFLYPDPRSDGKQAGGEVQSMTNVRMQKEGLYSSCFQSTLCCLLAQPSCCPVVLCQCDQLKTKVMWVVSEPSARLTQGFIGFLWA